MKPIHETIGNNYSRKEFVSTCSTDFNFFCDKVLNLNLAAFHLEWVNMFYSNPRSSVLAFRGSGKTTILGVSFPLWYMMFNKIAMRNHKDKKPARFLIVSNTMKQSTRILREMQTYIRSIEFLYNQLYPSESREGKLWTKQDIETKNECKVFCRPYTENIRSEHPHFILLEEASLFTDLMIYERAILPMAQTFNAHVMSIGTPMSEIDLLARHHSPHSGFITSKVPVIMNGKSTWEWRYSNSDIERLRKELGELTFAREYMCEIVSDDSRAIDQKAIVNCLDTSLSLNTNLIPGGSPQYDSTSGVWRVPTRVCGIDLAMSATGDYSVSSTLRDMGSGIWLLEHMGRVRGYNFSAHKEWISGIYNAFLPIRTVIDKSQFGQSLIDELRLTHSIPCDPFKFTPENRKDAIAAMIQMIESGRLIIPRSKDCPYTMQITDNLIHELDSMIPSRTSGGFETYSSISKHDDCVMSLAMACHEAIGFGGVGSGASGFYMKKW